MSMSSTFTKRLREKCEAKEFGSEGHLRHPPGGYDVLFLCHKVEQLERLVRDCQHKLPNQDQNEIERTLWQIMS